MTLQPVQAAGRLERYEGGYDPARDRLTLTEVRRRVLEQCALFAPEDVIPVPCHADNVAMAYAIRRGESFVPLTGLLPTDFLIEAGRNTISYKADPKLREGVFRLFSTHHSLRSRADVARGLAQDAGGSLRELGYRDLFRLLILEFIDAHAFDLRSIRKSCVHIVHPDGERIIPFDTYNLLYRDHLERQVLDPLREEVDPGHAIAPMLVPLRTRRR